MFLLLLLVAMPAKTAERMIEKARTLIGTPYKLGGRSRQGLDCQGVVFVAAEAVTRCSWRSYAVSNIKTIAGREFGAPVPELSPVATSALDVALLQPGDYVMLVGPLKNPAEAAIGALEGHDVWVWHVGLYSGGGRWIVGDHFAGAVIEGELLPYLKAHAADYMGIFVTRADKGPKPVRCKEVR